MMIFLAVLVLKDGRLPETILRDAGCMWGGGGVNPDGLELGMTSRG